MSGIDDYAAPSIDSDLVHTIRPRKRGWVKTVSDEHNIDGQDELGAGNRSRLVPALGVRLTQLHSHTMHLSDMAIGVAPADKRGNKFRACCWSNVKAVVDHIVEETHQGLTVLSRPDERVLVAA